MHIIALVKVYGIDILIVFLVLLLLLLVAKKFGKRKLLKILPELISEADEILGTKAGKLKKKKVIAWLFRRYPFLSLITTDKKLSNMIDTLVDEANILLKEMEEKRNADIELTQEGLKASVGRVS